MQKRVRKEQQGWQLGLLAFNDRKPTNEFSGTISTGATRREAMPGAGEQCGRLWPQREQDVALLRMTQSGGLAVMWVYCLQGTSGGCCCCAPVSRKGSWREREAQCRQCAQCWRGVGLVGWHYASLPAVSVAINTLLAASIHHFLLYRQPFTKSRIASISSWFASWPMYWYAMNSTGTPASFSFSKLRFPKS